MSRLGGGTIARSSVATAQRTVTTRVGGSERSGVGSGHLFGGESAVLSLGEAATKGLSFAALATSQRPTVALPAEQDLVTHTFSRIYTGNKKQKKE